MGNGGISPYSGGSGGRSPLEAMYTIIAVAIVLVFALIVELWKYPWQVWAFSRASASSATYACGFGRIW